MTATAFDRSRPIEIKLRSPEGDKAVTVRFPTDEEWAERTRRRKVLIRHLGRGRSETVPEPSEAADAELLAKIRLTGADAGAEVDPYEAGRILDQLALAEVEDVSPEPGDYRVRLRVPGAITGHSLRVPSAKELFEYKRSFARIVDLPYNRQEITINLAAGATLYDRLCLAVEGYAPGADGASPATQVPIIHKAAAVRAAIDALEAAYAEDGPEDFF